MMSIKIFSLPFRQIFSDSDIPELYLNVFEWR